MKVLILAGGKGTRLSPLTDHRPKILTKIHGHPVLYWLLKIYQGHDIILSLGHMHKMVLRWCYDNDADIRFVVEKESLGTSGAIKHAAKFLTGDGMFCVVNGDTLHDMNLDDILETINYLDNLDVQAVRVIAQNKLTGILDCSGVYFLQTKHVKLMKKGKNIDEVIADIGRSEFCFRDNSFLDIGSHEGLRYAKTSSLFLKGKK